jgi:hypothetical protein
VSINLVPLQGKLYNAVQAVELTMLLIALGREAGNQTDGAIFAVAKSIDNRVKCNWGGKVGWCAIIAARWQYSSINGPQTDPNLLKYPNLDVPPWRKILTIAEMVYNGMGLDPTFGATHYFDRSLDPDPATNKPDRRPAWAIDGSFDHTADIDAFHFFRRKT